MSQIFTIVEDTVVIDKLALRHTAGAVIHTGSLSVSGTLTVDSVAIYSHLIFAAQDPTQFASKPSEAKSVINTLHSSSLRAA